MVCDKCLLMYTNTRRMSSEETVRRETFLTLLSLLIFLTYESTWRWFKAENNLKQNNSYGDCTIFLCLLLNTKKRDVVLKKPTYGACYMDINVPEFDQLPLKCSSYYILSSELAWRTSLYHRTIRVGCGSHNKRLLLPQATYASAHLPHHTLPHTVLEWIQKNYFIYIDGHQRTSF
jgi:hypothetical protein